MKREDKNTLIDYIQSKIESYPHFYLTDISGLDAQATYELRKKCNEREIELVMVKNTFFRIALERTGRDYTELYPALSQNTTVMFSNVANLPGKLIIELNKKSDKPLFKAAYAEECIYVGAEQIVALSSIKSKNELIGDLIYMLQSPIKTVLGQLESGKHLIGGLVKTLSEKE